MVDAPVGLPSAREFRDATSQSNAEGIGWGLAMEGSEPASPRFRSRDSRRRSRGNYAPHNRLHEGDPMQRDARPISITPEQVARLVERGVGADDIARLLVSTGTWSEAGAIEIVSTLADRPAEAGDFTATESAWPGPFEEIPPLLATSATRRGGVGDGRGLRPHRPWAGVPTVSAAPCWASAVSASTGVSAAQPATCVTQIA